MLRIVMPARLGSSRLRNKMLQPIGDRPLICHSAARVYEALAKTGIDAHFVVATDSEEIARAVAFVNVVMTSPDCRSGTDRVGEAAEKMGWPESAVIVNVQADMPFLDPAALGTFLAAAEAAGEWDMLTAIADQDGVRERGGNFERIGVRWHVGLYAYTRAALRRFAALPSSPREERVRLEQLRAVDHGFRIGFCPFPRLPFEVNTAADLATAQHIAGCLK